MSYSSAEKPKRKRDPRLKTKALTASMQTLEGNQAQARENRQAGKLLPYRPGQITIRLTNTTPEPRSLVFELRQMLRAYRGAVENHKARAERAQRKRMGKGTLMSRRGVYDEDALQTATYARLILDSGSVPIGDGYFDPGDDDEPGRFVAVGTAMPEPEDLGPFCMGDSFVRSGIGTHPGTDRRRFDQIDPVEGGDQGPGLGSGWKGTHPAHDPNWVAGSGKWEGVLAQHGQGCATWKFVPSTRDVSTVIALRRKG